MAEKIEVQINGESRSFDAAAARAAQQAARLETALHNAAAAKSRAEAAAVKAAAATQNLAAAQKKAADAASDAAKKNDRTKASLDGIKTAASLAFAARACGRSSCSRHELR